MANRAALTGILFVLTTGIPWEYLPKEMGCGSGMTCWRRLRDWQVAGVWEKIHRMLLDRLRKALDRWIKETKDVSPDKALPDEFDPETARRIRPPHQFQKE